eukprot:SAG31_NODE_11674_length_1007_cov_4.552863_1_plen_102_part_01
MRYIHYAHSASRPELLSYMTYPSNAALGYVTALLQSQDKYKCLTEIKKWQYKDGDPLLELKLKPGAKPRPMNYKTPMHLLPELKKWIQEMLDKNFIRRSEST